MSTKMLPISVLCAYAQEPFSDRFVESFVHDVLPDLEKAYAERPPIKAETPEEWRHLIRWMGETLFALPQILRILNRAFVETDDAAVFRSAARARDLAVELESYGRECMRMGRPAISV